MTNHLKHIATKSRTRRADIELGLILAFIAGAINAGGFLAVSQYTSHMTGMLSAVADFIVLNQFYTAFMSFLFLLSFIFGAAISAITINLARSRGLNSEYAIALMLEAFLLIVFGLFFAKYFDSINATIALLCFIMGLQNAIITKISRAEIRTTHVTGMATDIGIELGKIFYKKAGGSSSANVQFYKLYLYTSLLTAFLLGGILGAILFKNFSYLAVMPFSLILVMCSISPILEDISKSKKL